MLLLPILIDDKVDRVEHVHQKQSVSKYVSSILTGKLHTHVQNASAYLEMKIQVCRRHRM